MNRIIADLPVADLAAAKAFYSDYLGLEPSFDLGWVTRLVSPETGACIQLLTADATAPTDPAVSVLVDDVDEAYRRALAAGYEIVHPMTTEPWGVRRFFVRAPDGTVLNMVHHPE